MLLKGASIISLAITIVLFSVGVIDKFYWLPLVFFGIEILIILIWAISAFIVTRFVDMKKEYNKRNPLIRFYVDCIIQSLQQLMNIKLYTQGKELLPDEKFLLVCNHRSAMDPLLSMGVLGEYDTGFVAKKELYKIPIISRLMHRSFCLCLDRGNIREEAKAILRAGQLIKEQVASVGIYPEGTRNKGDGLLEFASGSFKIAKKAGCPVVVSILRNSGDISDNTPFKRTKVYFDIIGVIDKEYVKTHNTTEISDMARSMMEEKLGISHNEE